MEALERLAAILDSVEELRSIVRTMKALSAVSIRQYERAVASLAGYSRTVEMGLHVVLRQMPPAGPVARRHPAPEPIGIVVFGSDQGLCGRFNEELAEFLRAHLHARAESGAVRVVAVGARMARLLDDASLPVDATLAVPGSAPAITSAVHQILQVADRWERETPGLPVHLFYSRRRSGRRAHPMAQRLLPVDLHRFHRLEEEPWPSPVLPTFSMNRERLFSALVRQYLFVSVFRACAESQAAEHASRLLAMQGASRNLDERHADLLAELHRRRQEAITAELLDVVSGYETLRTRPGP